MDRFMFTIASVFVAAMDFSKFRICVVGGAGHVGAPLAVLLASKGFKTLIYDTNEAALNVLRSGHFPFIEEGGDELLQKTLPGGNLSFSTDPGSLAASTVVIITIGTPIDEYHNPVKRVVEKCVEKLLPHLWSCQTLILRSTVSPGTTDHLTEWLSSRKSSINVAFCPERVVQGHATNEIQSVPQIVSATSENALSLAETIFGQIARKLVRMKPMEAEFAKLICNAYRYVQFAMTNQMYMLVQEAGCDYQAVLNGLKEDYPRMRDFPGPGFAAGPCLFKDTLQLAAGSDMQFVLGHAAIQINEGLPAFLIRRLKRSTNLSHATVGLLGMAFKAESDDSRSSLSYKLKKILAQEAKEVLTTDPFVTSDPDLLPLDDVVHRSDILIVGAPHYLYRKLKVGSKQVVDVWDILPKRN
jgi:UDP-N-acetyl-D-mannosaminuronic acid dehydrogenase